MVYLRCLAILAAVAVVFSAGIPDKCLAFEIERELVDVIDVPESGSGWPIPYVRDDIMLITSGDDMQLLCYDLDLLEMRWTLDAGAVDAGFEFAGFDNMLFSVVDGGQWLFSSALFGEQAVVIDRLTGSVLSAKEVPETRNALAIAGVDGELLVTTSYSELIVYDQNLAERYRCDLPGQPNGVDFDPATGELFICIQDPPQLCRYTLGGLVKPDGGDVETAEAETALGPFACCIAGDVIAVSCWDDATIRVHDRHSLEGQAVYPALPSIGSIEFFNGCLYAASHMQAKDEYGSPGALIRINLSTGESLRRDFTDLKNVITIEPYIVPGTLYCQDFGDMYLRDDSDEQTGPFAYFLNSKVAVINPMTLETLSLLEYPEGLYGTACSTDRGLMIDVECSDKVEVYHVTTQSE